MTWYFPFGSLVLALVLHAGDPVPASDQPPRPSGAASAVPPFGPEVSGLRAQVRLARSKFKVGEPILVAYVVRNVSSRELVLWHSGFWPNHLILVRDAAGKEAALTARGREVRRAFSPGGQRDKNVPWKLPAGGEDDTEGRYDLTELYNLGRAGHYTVQYIYEERQTGCAGRLPSNVLPFEVVAP